MTSSLSPLSAPFLSPLKIQKPKTLTSALLSPPTPRSNRKNHLRPKLPPRPGPLGPIPVKNPNLTLLIEEAPHSIQVESDLEESVQEITNGSQTLPSIPNPSPRAGSLVLDLSLRFAALLAVQTAVAVWFFSRAGKTNHEKANHEESINFEARVAARDVRGDEGVKGAMDFERMVSEIREMAKEARESEAKEREEHEIENESFLMGGLNVEDSGNEKLGPMKRLEFVRSNVIRRNNVGKGFNRSKKMEDGGDTGRNNGGIQQITHQNHVRDTLDYDPTVITELTKKAAVVEGSSVIPHEKLPHVGDLPQRTIEGLRIDNRTSISNHNFTEGGVHGKRNSKEERHVSSTQSVRISGRSHSQKIKAIESSTVSEYKDDIPDQIKKPWWLKLPFAIAILLRRGSDRSSPKGLYSLKMDPPSDDGDLVSYTIVFQDQGDATNFCYVLETFFEDLEEFSADIVPLTIDELKEGVSSGALDVIVVRKGQLQLYAGQPLAEVEIALRSLLNSK